LKPLIAIALALAQVVSWNAPAMFLCVSSCGAIRLDAGQPTCRCASEDCHTACCDACEADHDHDQPALADRSRELTAGPSVSAGSSGCDCTHLQLSWTGAPALRDRPDVLKVSGTPAIDAVSPGWDLPADTVIRQLTDFAAPADSRAGCLALLVRATIELRC